MSRNPFRKSIIALLGIEALPDEEKVRLVHAMVDLIERRVMNRLAKALSAEDARRLDDLATGGDPEVLAVFFRDRCPNLEEILKEEIDTVKREALAIAREIDAA